MPYISQLPMDQISPEMLKAMKVYDSAVVGDGLSQFVRIFAHARETSESFYRFYLSTFLAERGRINARIVELARIRVAQNASGEA